MRRYNVIVVLSPALDKLLMCRRKKEPFKGLSNFVGGKIEKGESGIDAAYRELFEETSITKDDIELKHLMEFTYHISECYIEVYVGRLKHDVEVCGDENDLYWSERNRNFFDMNLFAGGGNIGHILEEIKWVEEKLFGKDSA